MKTSKRSHFVHINRQPEKGSEYQTLVLNDGPFSNASAVFLFRRRARLFFTAVSKTDAVC